MSNSRFLKPILAALIWFGAIAGCGTTRLTDTERSASEEMLLSHAIDQSVGGLNLQVLNGHRVFLETSNLGEIDFSGYLTGALRQHLLASGARLVAEPEQAEVVVEARAGSVATGQHETLIGIPQTTVPAILFGTSATLPEIAIVKKTIHIGVAKVGVFAYRVDTGAGVWQSGMEANQSTSESNWYLGVGPFQTGDVVLDGNLPELAGHANTERRQSPLEHELWVGEMPPFGDPLGPTTTPSQEPTEEDDERSPEEIDPGVPEELPEPEERWQWVSPVVVSPDE